MHNVKLLKRSIWSFLLCVLFIVFCCLFIDKPVADFFSHYDLVNFIHHFGILTIITKWIIWVVGVLVVVLVIKTVFGDITKRWQRVLLAIAMNLLVVTNLKNLLKYVFSRSQTTNYHYGFNFFHSGAAYRSFPSGHAALIFGIMSIIWLVYPKLRWLCVLSCIMVILGLLVMNYHFVSDIIAGAYLGSIGGVFATELFSLRVKGGRYDY